jgi:hypothetical protein
MPGCHAAAATVIADVYEYPPYLSISTAYHLLNSVADILDAGAGCTGGHRMPVDKMHMLQHGEFHPALRLDKHTPSRRRHCCWKQTQTNRR